MNHLDSYLIKECLKPLFGFVAALSIIVWLSQSLQMLDLIINRGQSLGTFLLMTIWVFPSLLAVILPFALFCAVLFTLNRLTGDSEITVMWSSGVGNLRITRPLVIVALATTLATLIINLYLMPAGYRQMKDKVYEIRTDIASSLIKEGDFTHPTPGVTLSTAEANRNGEIRTLFLHDARNPDSTQTYIADHARVVRTPQGPRLILVSGTVQTKTSDGKVSLLAFKKHTLDISGFVQNSGPKLRELTERYLHELLFPDMSIRWEKRNAGRLRAEGHNRLASPLYNISLVVIALCAFLTGEFSRRGRGWRVTIAMGCGLVVRITGFGLQSLASNNAAFYAVQYIFPLAVVGLGLYWLSGSAALEHVAARLGRLVPRPAPATPQ